MIWEGPGTIRGILEADLVYVLQERTSFSEPMAPLVSRSVVSVREPIPPLLHCTRNVELFVRKKTLPSIWQMEFSERHDLHAVDCVMDDSFPGLLPRALASFARVPLDRLLLTPLIATPSLSNDARKILANSGNYVGRGDPFGLLAQYEGKGPDFALQFAVALNHVPPEVLPCPLQVVPSSVRPVLNDLLRVMVYLRRQQQLIPEFPSALKADVSRLRFLLNYVKGHAEVVRAKLVVIGRVAQGKTSFVRTLVSRSPSPTDADDPDRSTRNMELYSWSTMVPGPSPLSVESRIFDFAGQHMYANTHSFFITGQSVFVHCVNVADSALFDNWETCIPDRVLFWHRAIMSISPEADPILLATHSDLAKDDACERLRELLDFADLRRKRNVEAEIVRLRELVERHSSTASDLDSLQVRLEELKRLLLHWPPLPTRIIPFSAVTGEGLDLVRAELLLDAAKVKVDLPNTWVSFFDSVVKRAQELPETASGMVGLDELVASAGNILDTASAHDCLSAMHEMGELLWFRADTRLSRVVFISPALFIGKLREVLRHDMVETLSRAALHPLPPSFSSEIVLGIAMDELRDGGILHVGLLRSIDRESGEPLFPAWSGMSEQERDKLVLTMEHFKLARRIDEHRLMIPSYLPEAASGSLGGGAELAPAPDATAREGCVLEFPYHIPDPLFQELLVMTHRRSGTDMRRSALAHMLVDFTDSGAELSVRQARDPLTGHGVLYAEAAGEQLASCEQVLSWLVADVQEILQRFPGVQCDLYTVKLGSRPPRARAPHLPGMLTATGILDVHRVLKVVPRPWPERPRTQPGRGHNDNNNKNNTVFVSYAWNKDNEPVPAKWVQREFVPRLRAELQGEDVEIALDVHGDSAARQVRSGSLDWMAGMASDSRLVIVVASPGYVDRVNRRGGGVLFEWHYILHRRQSHDKPIIVVVPPDVTFENSVPARLHAGILPFVLWGQWAALVQAVREVVTMGSPE